MEEKKNRELSPEELDKVTGGDGLTIRRSETFPEIDPSKSDQTAHTFVPTHSGPDPQFAGPGLVVDNDMGSLGGHGIITPGPGHDPMFGLGSPTGGTNP